MENTSSRKDPLMPNEELEWNEPQEYCSSILAEVVIWSGSSGQAAVRLTACNKGCFTNLLAATTQPGHDRTPRFREECPDGVLLLVGISNVWMSVVAPWPAHTATARRLSLLLPPKQKALATKLMPQSHDREQKRPIVPPESLGLTLN